jgi:hypothetical protein
MVKRNSGFRYLVDVQRGVFDMDLCLVLAAKAAYFIATRNSQTP